MVLKGLAAAAAAVPTAASASAGADLKVAEVSGAQLVGVMSRANQFAANSLEARTGDYVHAEERDVVAVKTYRLAVNGWTAINQKNYLDTEGLEFADAGGLELKAVVAEYLAGPTAEAEYPRRPVPQAAQLPAD